MINIDMLNEMFGGDEEITQQLFELYLAENSEIGNFILQHYETNDLSTLFHTVHTLSGALGNLCEMNILPLIKEIEASAKVGNTPEKDTIDAVINGLDEIKQQMEVYLSAQ